MHIPFKDPLTREATRSDQNDALPLVGRETELQVIALLLETVTQDKPAGARALTISGEMGVGKTRLLAELHKIARGSGFYVLESSAYESGRMFPYFPFIEALRPILRSSTRDQLSHHLGLDMVEKKNSLNGEGGEISFIGLPMITALADLFPELPEKLGVSIAAPELSPEQAKFRLFDAIATLLERLALDRPLLLSIDNLQWADSASLELMLYLTIRLRGSQVALAGATRPPGSFNATGHTTETVVSTAATVAATRALSDLMRQGFLHVLPLGLLHEEAMIRHLRALLPGEIAADLIGSLVSRAGGNVFFLEELVRVLTQDRRLVQHEGIWQARGADVPLPESITLAVQQRLQGLSTQCAELLCVASLFGSTFPLAVLTRVLQQDEEQIRFLLDEARRAQVIERVPAAAPHQVLDTYRFCQGVVQEILRGELSVERARFLHGAIGRALEASYGDAAAAHAAELAQHFVLSGEKEAALHWSLLAGEDAIRQQALREAITHLRVVLELLQLSTQLDVREKALLAIQTHIAIGESWSKLGELVQACGAFQKAISEFQQEAEDSRQLHDAFPSLLAKVNRLLADAYRMQGKYDLALAHLKAAQDAIEAGNDKSDIQANNPISVPWIPGRSFSSGRQVLSPERVTTSERLLLLQATAMLDIFLNQGKEAETALWQSHQLATAIGDQSGQAFALHLIGWIRGWGEHIFEAIRLLKQACELYIAVGDPYRAALGEQGLGIIYLALGDVEQARLYTERGLHRARRYGVRYILGWLYWNAAEMALTAGDWSGCEWQLQRAMQEAEELNNVRLKPVVMQSHAQLHFRRGNWDEAERLFSAAIQAAGNTEWYPSTLALYGHFLAVTGRRGKAAARAQLDRAADFPEPAGFSGHFYIPFLAEGYLHLEAGTRAALYSERVRALRGFMHYGASVDRILGEVAASKGAWEEAQQAFEDGLALCRRANNGPEEAMILYEQARTALMRSRVEADRASYSSQHMRALCEQARTLFLQHGMQRAADLVDTLREGIGQLEQQRDRQAQQRIPHAYLSHPGYELDFHLTRRELEVLRLVAEGHTDREVAEILVISPRTVNRHLGNIFVKLDVPGRAAAVAYAIRWGLVG
ncbi:MAG TPA: AAA family ATPase [Ktedonobacteraceae bacterium]|jgi:DNA-binding CsgD family transcriptional regulator/tetratricopeptide (TPR) repeat protein|nr:AAA family ATPase [Ktedonobacteraceae bacterium]